MHLFSSDFGKYALREEKTALATTMGKKCTCEESFPTSYVPLAFIIFITVLLIITITDLDDQRCSAKTRMLTVQIN